MDNFPVHMTSGTQLNYINCTRVTIIIFFYYLELRRVRLQTYFLIKYTFFSILRAQGVSLSML